MRRLLAGIHARIHGDAGSSIPLILVCFLIVSLLTAGVAAASSAFLAQRDLQADCDGGAIAAASGLDSDAVYAVGVREGDALPVATEAAQHALGEYRSYMLTDDASLVMAATVDRRAVMVRCRRLVQIPFGTVFGFSHGLVRTAVSEARSPLR